MSYDYYDYYDYPSYDYYGSYDYYDYPSTYDYDFGGVSMYDPILSATAMYDLYPSDAYAMYDLYPSDAYTGYSLYPEDYYAEYPYGYDFTGSIYEDPSYVPPTTPTPTSSSTSALDSILKTLTSVFTSKGVLSALGLGATIGGKVASSGSGGSGGSTGFTRQQQPLGPYGKLGIADTYALSQLLYPQAVNPLNPNEKVIYDYIMGNLGNYMTVFPEETWARAEAELSQGEEARSLALKDELENLYGMKMEGRGNVNAKIIEETLAKEVAESIALSKLLQSRATAEQLANQTQPSQYASMLGLANYPEDQQQDIIRLISTILNNMAVTERGGSPTLTYDTKSGQDQSTVASLLAAIGPALLTLAGTAKG